MLTNKKIGFALTGSFCTIPSIFKHIAKLKDNGATIFPVLSFNVAQIDSRFISAQDIVKNLNELTDKKIINSIDSAEPIGPKNYLDALVIAPCTGNTLSKIASGISDTPVTLAAKAILRNKKPLIIAVSTNDGLASNAINLAKLLDKKDVYFVPFAQDDPITKSTSLIANFDKIGDTIKEALEGKQIQPIID